jgi:hypothetical protein
VDLAIEIKNHLRAKEDLRKTQNISPSKKYDLQKIL